MIDWDKPLECNLGAVSLHNHDGGKVLVKIDSMTPSQWYWVDKCSGLPLWADDDFISFQYTVRNAKNSHNNILNLLRMMRTSNPHNWETKFVKELLRKYNVVEKE